MAGGGEFIFRIVNARLRLGRSGDVRPAVELFVRDDRKHMLVPISSETDLFDRQRHFKIDDSDADFPATGLDPTKQSFVCNDQARLESEVVIITQRGTLRGRLARQYAEWSGWDQDERVKRVNPPRRIPVENLVWMQWPHWRAMTIPSRKIPAGKAEYNAKDNVILVPARRWPSWYWWVFVRAWQIGYLLDVKERAEWSRACRKHPQAASRLVDFWIGLRGRPLDVTNERELLTAAFTEACVLVFAQYAPEELPPDMLKIVLRLARWAFWIEE